MMLWYLYLLNAHQARHIFDLGLGECLTPHGRPWLRWSELGPCNSMQMEEREMGTRTLLRDLNWIELNWIIQCIYVVCSVVCEIHRTVAVCSLLQSIDRIIICPMPDPRKKKKETGKQENAAQLPMILPCFLDAWSGLEQKRQQMQVQHWVLESTWNYTRT